MNADNTLTIELNQTPTTLSRPMTLTEMLSELDIPAQGLALAVNQTVVPQTLWDNTPVKDRDRIQLFQAIAGG